MPTTYAAGHTFTDTATGRRCMVHNSKGEVCYRSWLEIKDTQEGDIGQPNIAHNGNLNRSEYDEITKERQREMDSVWEAITYAASAGAR